MTSLEHLRGEIFLHYIVEKKTLDGVMDTIARAHGVRFTKKQYNTKLAQWGYSKNTKRATVVAILREKSRREAVGKDSMVYVNRRPVNAHKIEKYRKRHKLQITDHATLIHAQWGPDDRVICRTPPSAERPLQAPLQLMIPEKILHGLDAYMRGSFESGTWKFFGNDETIGNSTVTLAEPRSIVKFQNAISLGCRAAQVGNYKVAFEEWKRVFLEIENLLKGTHEDITLILFTGLNDIIKRGFHDVAAMMIKYIGQFSTLFQKDNSPYSKILVHIKGASFECISALASQIWAMFHAVFDDYLGSHCYYTFLRMTGRARGKLLQDASEDIDHCLPQLALLDREYGLLNCRPLSVLRTRVEVLYQREQDLRVVEEASQFIRRAGKIQNYSWEWYHNLIKGHFYAGMAHYYLGNYESARQHLSYAVHLETEFCEIDGSGLFRSKRIQMQEALDMLENHSTDLVEPVLLQSI